MPQLHKQEYENSSSGSSCSKIIIIIVVVVVVVMNYLFLVGITYIYTNSSLTKKNNKSQLLDQWNDTAKTQLNVVIIQYI